MKPGITIALCVLLIVIVFIPPTSAQTAVSPYDLRAAYDVNVLLQSGYTGKGVTVAIVNTGIDATFYADVKLFSSKYGLPDPDISVTAPFGSAGTDNETPQSETTVDAEFVHAMAPDASMLLVLVGANHNGPDGLSYVIDTNAADIATLSPSWWWWGKGATNTVQSYNIEFKKSVSEKITLIAASNDFGSNLTVPYFNSGQDIGQHYPDVYVMPQFSPYVTAVGGTVLTMNSGSYGSEVGWSQSGGGPSTLFAEPSWQTGSGVPQNYRRNIPDIALDASCHTPYAAVWNGDSGYQFCGTSGGAPTFAGIVADIDQAVEGRVGFLNPTLYSLASSDPSVYHDVTSGCSLVKSTLAAKPTRGYCAYPGWDFVTGWGSVDAAKLADRLAPSAHMVPEFPVGLPIAFTTIFALVPLVTRRLKKQKIGSQLDFKLML